MDQLSGILLHVDFVDTDLFLTCSGIDLDPAVMADWQIQLGDLIVLRVIRVEIVLPVEFAVLVDAAVRSQSDCQCVLYHLLV